MNTLFHLLLLLFFLLLLSRAQSQLNSNNCTDTCGSRKVFYPFGFSSSCPIPLSCAGPNNNIYLSTLPLRNITPDTILVELPPRCNRAVGTANNSLFSNNFAPTRNNALFFRNCPAPAPAPARLTNTTSCVISTSLFSERLNLTDCGPPTENLTCSTDQTATNGSFSYSSPGYLERSRCGSLFSSVVFEADDIVLVIAAVELGWWVRGEECRCSPNANCTKVSTPVGPGFRCRCKEGFDGSGFNEDGGCYRDQNGSYHPLNSRTGGLSGGAIAGISLAVVVFVIGLVISVYCGVYKRKKARTSLRPSASDDKAILRSHVLGPLPTGVLAPSLFPPAGFTVDKSVEFSYEELAKATNDFSMANKIGEGGFGAVYYAELRGERAAIKKMDLQASREFLAELKVLTHVHHLNLVRLIGYCTEGSLFVVYEFIDNGNLSQHLRGSDWDPLEWSSRVQIALDSARGLEYIHEHTVPAYIHRDIKSANILIDKKFRAKVADFGLTKLTQAGGMTQPTRLVGTFGYMSPEYAQYGDVSPKVDVYAFGVVLFELISAKEAIVKEGSVTESTGLVALFEGALNQPDSKEHVRKLVDRRLGENFPIDSVYKLALLAKACTQENPHLRPSMRSIVVALMTLSSTTEDWDLGSFYENQAMVNLPSGR